MLRRKRDGSPPSSDTDAAKRTKRSWRTQTSTATTAASALLLPRPPPPLLPPSNTVSVPNKDDGDHSKPRDWHPIWSVVGTATERFVGELYGGERARFRDLFKELKDMLSLRDCDTFLLGTCNRLRRTGYFYDRYLLRKVVHWKMQALFLSESNPFDVQPYIRSDILSVSCTKAFLDEHPVFVRECLHFMRTHFVPKTGGIAQTFVLLYPTINEEDAEDCDGTFIAFVYYSKRLEYVARIRISGNEPFPLNLFREPYTVGDSDTNAKIISVTSSFKHGMKPGKYYHLLPGKGGVEHRLENSDNTRVATENDLCEMLADEQGFIAHFNEERDCCMRSFRTAYESAAEQEFLKLCVKRRNRYDDILSSTVPRRGSLPFVIPAADFPFFG